MKIGTVAIDIVLSKVNPCVLPGLIFYYDLGWLFPQHAQYAEQDFERLAATKSIHVGRLLGTLWMKKYHSNVKITISFDDMLQWSLWPNFIKLNGKLPPVQLRVHKNGWLE